MSVHSKVFLDLCSRSRAAVCFSGMLSATHYFSDLPEIETALPEMVTVLPEIEIALLQIDSPLTQSLFAVGLEFFLGRSRFAAWRLFDFWQVGKIIKVALSAVPKPTATWDLKWRSMLCLRRTFPKKKIKVSIHTGEKIGTVGISFKPMKSMKSLSFNGIFEIGHMCHIDDHYSK